jgi:hypothetical protein
MPKPLRKATREEPETEEDEPTPTKGKSAAPAKKGKGDSYANAFDDTPASSAGIPAGKHEALILEAELQDETEKGQSVRFKFGVVNSDEFDGKVQSTWYKIKNDDGTVGPGAGFLKKDLRTLGYENVKFADLEDTLAEIQKEQPYVEITAKQNGIYVNIYLNGQLNQDDKPAWPDEAY